MTGALIILIIFIFAFLLVARLYTTKRKKPEDTSQAPDQDPGDTGEAGTDE